MTTMSHLAWRRRAMIPAVTAGRCRRWIVRRDPHGLDATTGTGWESIVAHERPSFRAAYDFSDFSPDPGI